MVVCGSVVSCVELWWNVVECVVCSASHLWNVVVLVGFGGFGVGCVFPSASQLGPKCPKMRFAVRPE